MKFKIVSMALAVAALSSCMQQNMPPAPLHAVRPLTGDVQTERHNVKMVCGRAYGESHGFNLLGIIPITKASESEAVDRMYENAQKRGAKLEGPRQFVNTSYEKSANYFLVGSRPVIRVAADLVEIQGAAPTPATTPEAPAPAQQEDSGLSIGDIITAPYKWCGQLINSVFGA